jgi:ring-1,2-phenylacetyl-CoA epoxidase subunit PaaE
VAVTLDEPLYCPPGSFVNFFMDVEGEKLRRAFSVVHGDTTKNTITFAVRHTPTGKMTPEFWKDNITGRHIEVMGPMGLNTIDKLTKPHLFLFGFGIGAGVVKSIADQAVTSERIETITIVTGSRNEQDVLYRSYFDALSATHAHVLVRYVISSPYDPLYRYTGYIQNNITQFLFDNSDVYMCGQVKACDELKAKIGAMGSNNTSFFIEAFH